MTSGESINSGLNVHEDDIAGMESGTTLLLVTTLGGNNKGAIGPVGNPEEVAAVTHAVAERVASPEYSAPASNEWTCVDGRLRADAEQTDSMANGSQGKSLPAQTGGGLPITELSVDLMLDPNPDSVSKILADKTRACIANGQKVYIHGDTHVHYQGCGCNKGQRPILRENLENIDIIAPIAWDLGRTVGLDEHLTAEDVTAMIITGGRNAERDDIWDADPEEKAKVIVQNGGEYIVLDGEHAEYIARIDTTEQAFDVFKFVTQNTAADGTPIMAFNVSLGCLKKYYFDCAKAGQITERQAALRTMGAILHNGGTTKWLANENLQAAVVGTGS